MHTCFFCGAVDLNGSGSYECVATSRVPSSHKSVSLVLTHLANCIKANINLRPDAKVCKRCFGMLSEYDTIMVNLMTTQKKLSIQLKAALKSQFDDPDNDSIGDALAETELDNRIEADAQALFVELIKDEDDSGDIKDEYEDGDEFISEVEVGSTDKFDGQEASDAEEKSYMRKRQRQDCPSCGSIFYSKYQLQKHINEEHTKQQNHVCPVCGIVRRDEEYLELHMNLHEGKTEKQCRYCPKSFSRPVNTLRHMRMHWDKKKYQCEKCGLRFSQDNLLYNHRLRHEAEENPIICSICNVSFKSRKTFNHHTLIHKENRPRHYCSVCPKSFTERYTLKMHMKTHEGDVFSVREEVPADEQQVVEELQVDVDESEQAVTLIMSDTDENSGYCVICSSNFDTKKELDQHLQFDHDVVIK